MVSKPDSNKARLKRHARVRAKISGTAERPRLNVFRSAKHIYAQVIDDVNGVTLVSASTVEKDFDQYGGNKDAAHAIGLASCWIHGEKEMFQLPEGKALLKEWGLPENLRGVGSLALGYAAGPLPQPKERKADYIHKV